MLLYIGKECIQLLLRRSPLPLEIGCAFARLDPLIPEKRSSLKWKPLHKQLNLQGRRVTLLLGGGGLGPGNWTFF